MKAWFKFVVLFVMLHSALYSASICSDRKFVNFFTSSLLRNGANAVYCQGNTLYIVVSIYNQSEFEQLRYLDNASADLFAGLCTDFDDILRSINSSQNSNLRGNFAYVFEYNGQRIQHSCP